MTGKLTDRDEQRFAELRDKLDGVERAEEPADARASPGPLDPMLARTFEGTLSELEESSWIAERKYDGTRIVLQKFDGEVLVYTRRHVERSELLSDLVEQATETLPDGIILDGEYVFLDADGTSRFIPIHTAGNSIEEEDLSPLYVVFDVLAIDGSWCTRDPLAKRKERLADVVTSEGMMRTIEYRTDGFQTYFDELIERNEEGLIVKREGSAYHPGTRSDHWRKVKAFSERNVLAVGYTPGEGRRSSTFGALVLSDGTDYVGRVGSGFTDETLEDIRNDFQQVESRAIPISAVEEEYTPVEPFVVRVRYQEISSSKKLRAPVFVSTRPDVPVEDVPPVSP